MNFARCINIDGFNAQHRRLNLLRGYISRPRAVLSARSPRPGMAMMRLGAQGVI